MGFEILGIVPIKAEDAKSDIEKTQLKTRVAMIRTAGQKREDHTTALLLMECLDYDIDERCPSAFEGQLSEFSGEVEYDFEGCGEVLEYTAEELCAAAKRMEESDNDPSQKKAVCGFLDKVIEALDTGGWDKAEIGFF